MDQAAVFLSGSILYTLSFMIIFSGIIVVNNLLHKYWKPVKIFWPYHTPLEYQTTQIQDTPKS